MYLKVQALVLCVTEYNDTDALLSLLTVQQGKLTAKVRGLRRKNSPMIAPCQLLAYSEFVLFENKGYYTVNEAHTIELFQPLRKDLSKLSLGTYFAQVAEVLSQGDFPDPSLLSLTLNCMYALSKLNQSVQKVKAVFPSKYFLHNQSHSNCLKSHTDRSCHLSSEKPARRLTFLRIRLFRKTPIKH